MASGEKGKGRVRTCAGHLADALGWHEDVLFEILDFQITV